MTGAMSIEKELEAIKTIASTLEPFEANARLCILDYATKHLGITFGSAKEPTTPPSESPRSPDTTSDSRTSFSPKIVDIRTLRDQKRPSTDIHMAAVVAYYLAELAPGDEKKDAITPNDISKYFKQAGHPLPAQPRFTLQNAKNAGYFDSVGSGAFKLNAVGYNLVAHGLPKSGDNGTTTKPTKPRQKTRKSKKSAKK